ncbi:MAG: hypothetical protein COU27_00700 [Candidatus Levybacteria bacterium CG10_big_fil_rev_8_21_14_0_10_36_7]|nr:MAG: hypothetical protein COU27_00700 [Candidatus Levybacteria bacterium CG10_big_fil_rev_8_21_14_0_10_36_7]
MKKPFVVIHHEPTPEQFRIVRQERAAFLEARLDQLKEVVHTMSGDLKSSEEFQKVYAKLLSFIGRTESILQSAEDNKGEIAFFDLFIKRLDALVERVNSLDFSVLPLEREQTIRDILELIEVH